YFSDSFLLLSLHSFPTRRSSDLFIFPASSNSYTDKVIALMSSRFFKPSFLAICLMLYARPGVSFKTESIPDSNCCLKVAVLPFDFRFLLMKPLGCYAQRSVGAPSCEGKVVLIQPHRLRNSL